MVVKYAVPGTHFKLAINYRAPIFLLLFVNVGIVRVGDGLSFPIAFIRACISVAVNVIGVGEGTGSAGAGGWFWGRVVIRSICCLSWSLTGADVVVCSVSDSSVYPWPP